MLAAGKGMLATRVAAPSWSRALPSQSCPARSALACCCTLLLVAGLPWCWPPPGCSPVQLHIPLAAGPSACPPFWLLTPLAAHLPHGRHSLDDLEALVRDKFDAVPDGGIAPPRFGADAVTPAQGGALVRMVPQRDGHSVELQASCRPRVLSGCFVPARRTLGDSPSGMVAAACLALTWRSAKGIARDGAAGKLPALHACRDAGEPQASYACRDAGEQQASYACHVGRSADQGGLLLAGQGCRRLAARRAGSSLGGKLGCSSRLCPCGSQPGRGIGRAC